MKFIHLADLHLGKKIGDYDLEDVQRDALKKIVELTKEKNIEAVVLAGDVYDSKNPSIGATNLLDEFLSDLFKLNKTVLMISGNHDQEDKLHFGSNILKNNNIYIVTNVLDSIKPVKLGEVNFYLLPYINKYDVRNAFKEDGIETLDDAIKYVIEKMNINKDEKNVIVSHQAVLSSKEKPSGSEVSITVDKDGFIGGEDIVSAALYKDFNYVALGHIHKRMKVSSNAIYPGALLKYHRDEAGYKKSFTIVDTNDFSIEEVPFKPLRDVVLLEGSYDEVKKMTQYKEDYVFFKLSDNDYVENAMAKLKAEFPYACAIAYQNVKNNYNYSATYENIDEISKFDLFNDLYKQMEDEELNEYQIDIVKGLIKEIWEEE